MNENKTQAKSKWWIALVVVAVIVLAVLGISKLCGDKEVKHIEVASEVAGVDGVRVLDVMPYSGAYWEDGSNAQVKDVMSVVVTNTGRQVIQLATLVMRDQDGNTYSFQFTSLWPGENMVVLEQNRAVCKEAKKIIATELNEVARFDEEPTMCEDVLAVTCADQAITVKNVSGEAFPGGRVFYKNQVDGMLLGGITYMVTVPALEKDEEISIHAGHYSLDGSRVLFVTYAK